MSSPRIGRPRDRWLRDLADEQLNTRARPRLKQTVRNLADYDTVFIGYPIWWYDVPMPLHTFLEGHDFKGKNAIPFNTHGGSRLAGTVDSIVTAMPGATVVGDAFAISRDDMDDATAQVTEWIAGLNRRQA
ncbi:flavodoxin [Streptomyces exfoliatus]|uniref:flavodoxin n=1 Tax=Streptomyces exfoliatus TaxID=1905 RepID=UPI000463BE34|nr:flavodoxin [Streptomyces exfoliatus]